MLAQNFKTPAALRISQEEFDALTKTLVMLPPATPTGKRRWRINFRLNTNTSEIKG